MYLSCRIKWNFKNVLFKYKKRGTHLNIVYCMARAESGLFRSRVPKTEITFSHEPHIPTIFC